jgi:hypothetical protein
MCHVPDDWQARLDAPVLTGQAGIPIVPRTSAGPAAVGFNPNDLGSRPAPAQRYLFYPLQHPLAPLDKTNDLWNHASQLAGIAFVSHRGKAAVMFFGTRGLGEYWYGLPEENGKKDPHNPYKGNHAPPYEETVWLYDPNDLLLVKEGKKRSWEIKPYSVGRLPGVRPSSLGLLGGVAYDPASGELYVSQSRGDLSDPSEPAPLIHVYGIAAN